MKALRVLSLDEKHTTLTSLTNGKIRIGMILGTLPFLRFVIKIIVHFALNNFPILTILSIINEKWLLTEMDVKIDMV